MSEKGTTAKLPFHKRFGLGIDIEEAKRRFMNRVSSLFFKRLSLPEKQKLISQVEFEFGRASLFPSPQSAEPLPGSIAESFTRVYLDQSLRQITSSWMQCLAAVEIAYSVFKQYRQHLSNIVGIVLGKSEADLGIAWRSGVFVRKGADLLDEALIHDVLEWLAEPKYENVRNPFAYGLSMQRSAGDNAEKLKDTVTNMYEALEAMAKIVTEQDRDLGANSESFSKALDLCHQYREILSQYKRFGDSFRHAEAINKGNRQPRPKLTVADVEFFVYLTGLFVRLALEKVRDEGAKE